ncbi:DGQHR domain-containing protein [Leisingera sp. NJS204]|uniref:DGQHR domain-containing protein n=1 Tax=Leisingera sp. NJS204 TaxID=2508307 RepID=UPI0010127D15|nr:DGQHR domain-containing protein [Leisingera sp. NJS204]QAX28137.1 DGQHR domain-containing protein [Leisingera sp. NJS204]
MAKDSALQQRLVDISKNSSKITIERLTTSEVNERTGLSLGRSPNPIYKFSFEEDGVQIEAIAFTLILNGAGRPATRAEALGQAIASNGENLFQFNPFLLVFDYSASRFLSVSAAKLFGAFSRESSDREIPFSDSASFSLTPSFEHQTINMYTTVSSDDLWSCNNLEDLSSEEIQHNILRFQGEAQTENLSNIVAAASERLDANAARLNTDEILNHSQDRLSYTASLVTQGRHRFYSLTIPSETLADCSFVVTRNEDRDQGFQRYLSKDRATEIATYLDSGLGTIPTSIIVSAQEECAFKYDGKKRTVSFDKIDKAFLILDGQHRVYGFKLAKNTMRVPVVIYNGLSRSEEAQLFIDINTKQKPVPSELLLDIKKLSKTQGDDEKRISTVFDLFDSEPGSSLLGKLSPHEKKNGLISRVTFNAALKPLIDFFGEASPEVIYATLNPYYDGVQSAFSAISRDIDFFSPMTFRGMTLVFPEIREKVMYKSEGDLNKRIYHNFLVDALSGQKLAPLKGRQRSYTGIVTLITEALKPKRLF